MYIHVHVYMYVHAFMISVMHTTYVHIRYNYVHVVHVHMYSMLCNLCSMYMYVCQVGDWVEGGEIWVSEETRGEQEVRRPVSSFFVSLSVCLSVCVSVCLLYLIYRKNRKLCMDFIRAIRAGSGLLHNKKTRTPAFLHINRKNRTKKST